MKNQLEWIVISLLVLIAGLLSGVMIGWNARSSTTNDHYIRKLAEKHEAAQQYWDTKTAKILTENSLTTERRKQNGSKKED